MEGNREYERAVAPKDKKAQDKENEECVDISLVKSLKRECKVETRAIEVDGKKIYYLSVGNGNKEIIMIHGAGLSSAKDFTTFICDISEDYRVVVPDLPGFGMNSGIKADYTIDYYADFLSKFINATGLKKPAIIAQSMGGGIALKYALSNKESVDKLVLINSYGMIKKFPCHALYYMSFCLPIVGEQILKLALKTRWLKRYILGLFMPDGINIDNELIKRFDTERGFNKLNATFEILKDEIMFNSLKSCFTGSFTDINFPTMVIHGENDTLFSKDTSENAVKSIPNYKDGISKFEVLRKQKHNLNEQGMKRAERLVIAFLMRDIKRHDL
jgi:pimeloyl-ACP methyl ester carboxylesterase